MTPTPLPGPAFVLDGSVVFAWHFADEQDDYADAVAAALPTTPAVVPSLWRLEVANTLVVGERRGRSTEAQAAALLADLSALDIRIDAETDRHAWTETLRLARAHGLTAYDAAYLELAVRLGLPLATLDGKLAAAAQAVGVPSYAPPPLTPRKPCRPPHSFTPSPRTRRRGSAPAWPG